MRKALGVALGAGLLLLLLSALVVAMPQDGAAPRGLEQRQRLPAVLSHRAEQPLAQLVGARQRG